MPIEADFVWGFVLQVLESGCLSGRYRDTENRIPTQDGGLCRISLSNLLLRRRVESFNTMAEPTRRAGRMNRVHKPVMIRSAARSLGARLRPRFKISS